MIIEMNKADMDENYTYIVRCADGTLYTGWTNDLKKRIKAHNSGKGAKYTDDRALMNFSGITLKSRSHFIYFAAVNTAADIGRQAIDV